MDKREELKQELEEVKDSFTHYVVRHMGWAYVILIIAVLFGPLYVYTEIHKANSRMTTVNNHMELNDLQKKVEEQERRIQELEEQIEKLIKQP